MIIDRVWAMPNRWTFKIPPIAELLRRYTGDGKGWLDPFSGRYSPAEFTNDLDPAMPAQHHLKAEYYLRAHIGRQFDGVIFDPPYNLSQLKECYKNIGLDSMSLAEANHFPHTERLLCAKLIKTSGLFISFGWNSQGIGKTNGFTIIEILLVCHGRSHNDTICTVEQKIQSTF